MRWLVNRRIAPVLFGVLFAALTCVLCISWYGSPARAVAAVTGEPLCIEPRAAVVVLDEKSTGAQKYFVTNLSGKSMQVLGVQLPCSCLSTSLLPVSIAPSETISIEIKLVSPPNSRQFRLNFLTDNQERPVVSVFLSGS